MLKIDDLDAETRRLAALLPPFPQVVVQLLDMLHDEEVSLEALSRVARNDPVIASNILATANRVRRINAKSDLHDPFVAASLIGVNQLRRIVAMVGMNRFLAEGKGSSFLFAHSRAVAIVAQELAALSGVAPEKAYVAGIMHDMGQLCFHILDPALFQEAHRQSGADGRLLERETASFGIDHTQIGARLAEYWKLPEDFVSAILTHHDDTIVSSKLQAVINLAESLTRALDIPPSAHNRVTKLNALAVETLGIVWDSPELLDCFGRCQARFRQAMS